MKRIEVKTVFYTFVQHEIFITTYDVRSFKLRNILEAVKYDGIG